jgi:hypothetical protein
MRCADIGGLEKESSFAESCAFMLVQEHAISVRRNKALAKRLQPFGTSKWKIR